MFKKKNKVSSLVVVLSLMLAVSGCGDDSTSSQTAFNQMFAKRGTIQGKIIDANTNLPIAGADLKITLIQGTQHRSPSLLITNETHPLAGEYAFSDVPVELDNGNITYKMVVRKEGYQDFSGNVTLADSGVQTIAGTTDTFFNRIANIYLFKLGESVPDVEVVVQIGGEPVVGAQVRLQPNAFFNVAAGETGNRLVASPGDLPSLTATTVADANGQAVATFSGGNLVLGGAYTPTVVSLNHEGIQLVSPVIPQIIVGASITPVVVAMLDLEPGVQNDGIHVKVASNNDAGDITNTGVLTLVFNRPVAVVADLPGETPFTATLVNPGAALLTGANTAASVTAVLSADGLTLRLTPNFATAPVVPTPTVAGDPDVDVVFAGGLITVAGDEGAAGNAVFGLSFLNGAVISTTVHVTGP